MASTQQKREWWAAWRCNPTKMKTVTFPGSERDWNLPVADAAVPAFQLFASLMRRHGYLFREVSGGTYNCRYIGGTTSWSLHAYGIAIDINPSKNPYGTTKHNFPQGFIDDVLATGLFRWGMDFRDPMHWEIDVPPSAIGDDMASPAQKMMVDLAFNLFPDELQGDPNYWLNLDEHSAEWDTAFRPALSRGAQNLYQKTRSGSGDHNHDGQYVRDVIVSR